MIRLRYSLLLFCLTSACSPLRLAENLLSSGQSIRRADVAYGSNSRQRLDVYRPRARTHPAPVVVFLYGGRWQSGSKDQYRLLGDALARRGVVVVVPDYRLYPEVKFPAWVEDAAQTVKWTRNNIERLGGDTAQIWVVGHSSGAHTAVLLALDDRYLRDAGLPANAVRGYVSIAGPVDTVWTDADVQALMGPPEGWPATYPRTYIVEGREPNLLFLHGSDDKTVSPNNSITLAARISNSGGCARAVVYRGVSHVEIVVAFSIPQLGIAPVMSDVLDFIHRPRTKNCYSLHRRQHQCERAANPGCAIHAQLATDASCKISTDREAEPGAFVSTGEI